MNFITTHRKCMACGTTTTNLNEDKCSCGRYMHLIGQVYTPKVLYSVTTAGNVKTKQC